MGATRHPNGEYTIACEKRGSLPELVFTFFGHEFSIGPEDYVFNDGDHCISALMSAEMPVAEPAGAFAIVGTVFLRKWYSIFDFGTNTVGLAKAKRYTAP